MTGGTKVDFNCSPLSEHKWPAGTSISQRTVPREHVDTSSI